MNIVDRLQAQSATLVDEAVAAVARAGLHHYQTSGEELTREHLSELLDLVITCLRTKQLTPILEHADEVAKERYDSGFDLEEVQIAFNVLEEAAWLHLVHEAPTDELAEDLGLVATVLGAGKDQLARTYVTLASHHKAPSMDMRALFEGVSTNSISDGAGS
jgi:hypothetical protein